MRAGGGVGKYRGFFDDGGYMARRKKFDEGKGVREIARERVGTVPATKVIVSKLKKPPKYKRPPGEEKE